MRGQWTHTRHGAWLFVALAILCGCSSTPSSGPSSANSSAVATPVQFTPIVMKVLSSPRWFTGTDGRIHVVYELQLSNGFPVPATVKKVAVRNAATGTEVTTLSGERLRAAMSLQSTPTTPTVELPPSTVGMLWLDVEFDSSAKIPRRLDHSLTVAVPPGLPVSETTTYTGAPGDVVSTPPTVIGPPLGGTGWMAVGSCCDGPHRRAAQPINNALWLAQRFAIDFNKINPTGLLASGDPGRNENWYTYDQPVLAVTDSEVVAVENTLPDQIPDKPAPVTIDDADGNYVILKLGDGRYAFYAHLKPGSVTVKAGEQVSTGQVIAHTGNSGSSREPICTFSSWTNRRHSSQTVYPSSSTPSPSPVAVRRSRS
ncbi:M23 family metallopeptidase [Gordonia sp. CPCC 205515]|uniref:M23 family metallopeptidase n=1 Tax=Gordonia sp. CPCC 205515 TaxID=3140791 RepID=UPI003AF3428E